MKACVGLPQAFFYFTYGQFWEKMLQECGVRVLLSGPTDRRMIEEGAALAPEGACLPIRVLLGHIAALGRQQPDYIFIPRIVRWETGCTCPKTAGLSEIVRFSCPDLPPLLTPVIEDAAENPRSYFRAGKVLGLSRERIRGACRCAWEDFCRKSRREEDKAGRTIGLIGHPYLTEDPELNFHLRDRLREAGYACGGLRPPAPAPAAWGLYPKAMFWKSGRDMEDLTCRGLRENWAGFIFLSAMGCGPDSCSSLYCENRVRQMGKPCLELVLDEQSASAGAQTRIEAFLDMVEREAAQ